MVLSNAEVLAMSDLSLPSIALPIRITEASSICFSPASGMNHMVHASGVNHTAHHPGGILRLMPLH